MHLPEGLLAVQMLAPGEKPHRASALVDHARIICNEAASKRFDYPAGAVPVPGGDSAAASAVPSGDPSPVHASQPVRAA